MRRRLSSYELLGERLVETEDETRGERLTKKQVFGVYGEEREKR